MNCLQHKRHQRNVLPHKQARTSKAVSSLLPLWKGGEGDVRSQLVLKVAVSFTP